jgi:lysophospholipase L1-like esterase
MQMTKTQIQSGQYVKNLLTLAVTILLVIFVAEGAARVWMVATDRSLPKAGEPYRPLKGFPHKADPLLGYRLIPGFRGECSGWLGNPQKPKFYVEVNNQGFRSSSDYRLHTAGQNEPQNVLLLGDSMVFGLYTNQDAIFSEVLNRRQGDYFFINTGVSGYSTTQEYLLLKQIIDQYAPIAVFLFYTQENDTLWNFRPSVESPWYELVDDKLTLFSPLTGSRPGFLHRHSALYLFFNYLSGGRDLEYMWNRAGIALWSEQSYPWRVTAGILGKFQSLLDGRDIRMIIMDIPTIAQTAGRLTGRERQRVLRELAESLGFEYHDLEQAYAPAQEGPPSLFHNNDSHWNEAGHELIADEVMSILKPDGPLISHR